MTEEQHSRCKRIIHSHAVAAGAGNAVPVPGVGFATDTITMTTMAMNLASVFGQSIPENVAKSMAIAALKRTLLKQPIKTMTKELSKLIPCLGLIVAPTISVVMIETAGWSLANDMAQKCA